MKTLRTFWREASIIYLEMALQSLCNHCPSHDDIPEIILEINRLKSERLSHV